MKIPISKLSVGECGREYLDFAGDIYIVDYMRVDDGRIIVDGYVLVVVIDDAGHPFLNDGKIYEIESHSMVFPFNHKKY